MKTLRLALIPALSLVVASASLAGPDVTPGGTWVTAAEVSPPWAEEDLRALQREVAQRLDHDGYPQAATLRDEQKQRLAALRGEAQQLISAEVSKASAELLAAWQAALDADQWTGFSKLPALHSLGPRELRDVLRLTKPQLRGMQQAEKAAHARLQAWRARGLRDWLREQSNQVVDQRQRVRLATWKRLANTATGLERRVTANVGEESAAVLLPHVRAVLTAKRESSWERFELLERLDVEGYAAKHVELLAQFEAKQTLRALAIASSQATLRELSDPRQTAWLVGLGILD